MLVICMPSFGGTFTIDNLGGTNYGTPQGTFGGVQQLAQRFAVTNDSFDYTNSIGFSDFGWTTVLGSAFQMQVIVTDGDVTSARLSLVNDPLGDVGFPTVSIYSDIFNPIGPGGVPGGDPQFEPNALLGTLSLDLTDPALGEGGIFPTDAFHNVRYTNTSTPLALVDGASYWVVVSSPDGVNTEWSTLGAPEPVSLTLVGGALVLLSLCRKRQQK